MIRLLVALAPLFSFLAVIFVGFAFLEANFSLLEQLHAALQSLQGAVGTFGWGDVWGKLDRIFPMGEGFAVVSALFTLRILAALFRIVKSFVHGVS
ncbi:MAG: hypothetical protein KDK99_16570 [Verrucomicrobiales bacterium]|nr:hypothetical protein [Verrucomicrobiales bacterium]